MTPSSKVVDTVDVVLVGGRVVGVPVLRRVGPYALHRRVWFARPEGPGICVTHAEARIAVWHTRTEAEAVRVAEWLVAHHDGLTERAGVMALFDEESSMRRTELYHALSRIVPQYNPYVFTPLPEYPA